MLEQETQRSWIRRHPIWTVVIAIFGALAILVLLAWFLPFSVEIPASNPANSYEEAIARIERVQADEAALGDVLPDCVSTLMTHGERTENVIVLMHGYTSCPEQFCQLGQEFFDKGYNVYIPRQPYHGLQERIDNELRYLTAEDLAAYGTESADIAQGLGEHVSVAGLSGGGSVVAWLAQHRADVDEAMPIAPFLGIGFIPAILNRPLTHVVVALAPSIFYMWWDPRTKADNPFTAAYSYPRYTLKSLMEVMRLGFAAEEDAKREKPAAADIVVLYNAADKSVNNAIIEEFINLWEREGPDLLTTYKFEEQLGLPHDLITPTRIDNQIELVYPVIHDLIESARLR